MIDDIPHSDDRIFARVFVQAKAWYHKFHNVKRSRKPSLKVKEAKEAQDQEFMQENAEHEIVFL